MNQLDYMRLATLGEKVRAGSATNQERDEYMELLYRNGSITRQQYNDYRAGRNADEILNAALAVGAIILIGHLLKAIFSK
ncbi:MAG: hypothetical protein QY325_08465 [Flavobacteriales bacterium]|nr:MAG: hypothetical protein QY325_08465 [Flavobacteriales bacterium]